MDFNSILQMHQHHYAQRQGSKMIPCKRRSVLALCKCFQCIISKPQFGRLTATGIKKLLITCSFVDVTSKSRAIPDSGRFPSAPPPPPSSRRILLRSGADVQGCMSRFGSDLEPLGIAAHRHSLPGPLVTAASAEKVQGSLLISLHHTSQ